MKVQAASQSSPLVWPIYRTLVGVGMLCALTIVLVFLNTRERIQQNRLNALNKAVYQVLPGARWIQTYVYTGQETNPFVSDTKVQRQQSALPRVYAGFNQNKKLVGIALPAQGQGYQDVIRILYGYDPIGQKIVGMQVLESRETPGLGDKIEKDPGFLDNFTQLDVSLTPDSVELANHIQTVKQGNKRTGWQIDGITGATISSEAIGQMLNNSIREWAPRIQLHLPLLQRDVQNTSMSEEEGDEY